MWPFNDYKQFNKYGWRRQLPDQRDKFFKIEKPKSLPKVVDLRIQCPPIQDQEALGSCTSNALAGAIEFLDIKDGKKPLMFSRLFLYYNERSEEGTVGTDSGAALRDGIKSLANTGVCLEPLWPYNIDRFCQKPNQNCYNNATFHRALLYEALNDLNGMQQCLASGFPFVFGFSVYQSFESEEVAKTGTVPMPGPDEEFLGGHAVLAVGYNTSIKSFIVRNSWGPDWGQKGYFTIPFDYLANPNLAADFWVVKKTVSE